MENRFHDDDAMYYGRDGRLYYKGYDVPVRRENVAPKTVGFDMRAHQHQSKPALAKKVSLERKLTPEIHVHSPAASIERRTVTSSPSHSYSAHDYHLDGSLGSRHSNYSHGSGLDSTWHTSRNSRPLPAPPVDATRGRAREWVEMNSLSRSSINSDRYLLGKKSHGADDASDHRVALYVPLLVFGLFLIACGVINSMFCADSQLYFRFWVGIMVNG